jgi:FtsX-like permease family
MRLSTLARLAWTGNRTDRLRPIFTGTGAAIGTVVLLAAATVHWIPPTQRDIGGGGVEMFDPRYTSSLLNETERRPWVAAALLLLTLPALVFAAQSARLGAPTRDRRLAAIRLTGATPGQTRLIAVVEAAAACFAGALAGIACYFALRAAFDHPVMSDPIAAHFGIPPENLAPHLPLPTDALPPLWVFPAVVIVIPAVAALLTVVALRRVTVTPLAVSRRVRMRRLRLWPLAVVALGFVVLAALYFIDSNNIGDQDLLLPLTGWTAVLLLVAGTALCAAPLGQLAARLTRRFARRAAPLIAARWIIADPWSGSRSLAVLLMSVFAGAASIRGTAYMRAGGASGWITESGPAAFALAVLVMTIVIAAGGLLFAIVEGLLTRRRALASLVAAGVPRATLAKAVLWQALLPAVPAVLLAIAVGLATVASAETMPIPWGPVIGDLALLAIGAIIAVAGAAGASLVVLRSSVSVSELRTE